MGVNTTTAEVVAVGRSRKKRKKVLRRRKKLTKMRKRRRGMTMEVRKRKKQKKTKEINNNKKKKNIRRETFLWKVEEGGWQCHRRRGRRQGAFQQPRINRASWRLVGRGRFGLSSLKDRLEDDRRLRKFADGSFTRGGGDSWWPEVEAKRKRTELGFWNIGERKVKEQETWWFILVGCLKNREEGREKHEEEKWWILGSGYPKSRGEREKTCEERRLGKSKSCGKLGAIFEDSN